MKEKSDPYLSREAAKYDNPIPSREFIIQHLTDRGAPASHRTLCKELDLSEDDQIEALRRRLRAMERDGQLIFTRKRTYGLVDKMDLLCGYVQYQKDGFGVLETEQCPEKIYLSPRQMRQVFDGDKVLVRVSEVDIQGRREGVIVEVLEHNTHRLVGRFYRENGLCYVVPENQRVHHTIYINDACSEFVVKTGQYVIAEIVVQPQKHGQPQGVVREVLGDHLAPGAEIDVAIRVYNIPNHWNEEVVAETAKLESYQIDASKRIDLRELPFVTIDGEDAKDFDDAVFCESRHRSGWRLYVAIADVSSYVEPKSAIDKEAESRGNSVYFPDHVVPMLPEILANDLCSLRPHEDRACLICEMDISKKGEIKTYQFYEGVIHSKARLTYTQVANVLQAKHSSEIADYLPSPQHFLSEHLERLYQLYHALFASRKERGALDFETVETKILFAHNRKIDNIIAVTRNDAHRIIEECMLCANVAAARFLKQHDLPGLYRIHDQPKEEKLENLFQFLGELGLGMKGKRKLLKAKDFQGLLEKIQGRPDAHLIQTVMLRSMNQAMYSHDNIGHFGLAYPAYTHFTSPIRRYPDLLVHRAIRSVIRSSIESKHIKRVSGVKKLTKKAIFPYQPKELNLIAQHCSMTERRADDATRYVVSWLKCEYMKDQEGEVYSGIISGVTGFGIFVELENIYVEGLVHVSALTNDYYHFDPVRHCLRGEKTGTVYRLGDRVNVRVVRVNIEERKIDLEIFSKHKKATHPKKKPASQKYSKKKFRGR